MPFIVAPRRNGYFRVLNTVSLSEVPLRTKKRLVALDEFRDVAPAMPAKLPPRMTMRAGRAAHLM
jgi:hypothetical protein